MSRLALVGLAALLIACPSSSNLPGTDTRGDATGVTCRTNDDCAGLNVTPCQLAVCDTTARRCGVLPKVNGTACSTHNACVTDQSCLNGTCGGGSPAPSTCGERECGSDSCGVSCGSCGPNATCTAEQMCEESVDPCGGITFEGCCTASGATRWCDDGEPMELDCPSANAGDDSVGPNCGWIDAEAYYYCTYGEPDPDPSAGFTYLCPGETCPPDACDGRECGFACGQSCGTCSDASDTCLEGQCVPDTCKDLTFVGCCSGALSVYCNDNEVVVSDCAADGCGWDADNSWYDCGFSGGDPSGDAPFDCDEIDFVRPPGVPEPVEPGPEPGPEPMPEAPADDASAEGMPDAGGTDSSDEADATEPAGDASSEPGPDAE